MALFASVGQRLRRRRPGGCRKKSTFSKSSNWTFLESFSQQFTVNMAQYKAQCGPPVCRLGPGLIGNSLSGTADAICAWISGDGTFRSTAAYTQCAGGNHPHIVCASIARCKTRTVNDGRRRTGNTCGQPRKRREGLAGLFPPRASCPASTISNLPPKKGSPRMRAVRCLGGAE